MATCTDIQRDAGQYLKALKGTFEDTRPIPAPALTPATKLTHKDRVNNLHWRLLQAQKCAEQNELERADEHICFCRGALWIMGLVEQEVQIPLC